MNSSMISAAVTMGQLQKKLDIIGNNLANTDTNGYKRRDASFSELLFQQVNNQVNEELEVGRRSPNGIRVGSGARLSQAQLQLDQGAIKDTSRPLDVAIQNKSHFFQVEVSIDGVPETRYTRDGAFYLSPIPGNEESVNLVTANGDYVLGAGGERISIPTNAKNIQIRDDGAIFIEPYDNPRGQAQVGQLELVEIVRPQSLIYTENNQYSLPDLEAVDLIQEDILAIANIEDVSLKSRALEKSNVDMSKEITDMIMTQRSFQFNAKSISMADQMMNLVNTLR